MSTLKRFRIIMTDCGISPRLDPEGDWVRYSDVDEALRDAAPDMYEALRECPLPSTMGDVKEHYQRFYDWYNKHVAAALYKAEGRSND